VVTVEAKSMATELEVVKGNAPDCGYLSAISQTRAHECTLENPVILIHEKDFAFNVLPLLESTKLGGLADHRGGG
jgi:chaperonin GroEL (HSP60 family)